MEEQRAIFAAMANAPVSEHISLACAKRVAETEMTLEELQRELSSSATNLQAARHDADVLSCEDDDGGGSSSLRDAWSQ